MNDAKEPAFDPEAINLLNHANRKYLGLTDREIKYFTTPIDTNAYSQIGPKIETTAELNLTSASREEILERYDELRDYCLKIGGFALRALEEKRRNAVKAERAWLHRKVRQDKHDAEIQKQEALVENLILQLTIQRNQVMGLLRKEADQAEEIEALKRENAELKVSSDRKLAVNDKESVLDFAGCGLNTQTVSEYVDNACR